MMFGKVETDPSTGFSATPKTLLLFGFAAASWLLLPVWFDIFGQRGTAFEDAFIVNHHFLPIEAQLEYLAGLAAMIVLALLIAGMTAVSFRYLPARVAQGVPALFFAAVVLFLLNVVRVFFLPWANAANIRAFASDHVVLFVLALIAGIVAVGGTIYLLRAFVVRSFLFGAAIGAIVVLNIVFAAVSLGDGSVAQTRGALAAKAGVTPENRVVWIIFDEADYRLLFEQRPDGLELPTFDALAERGFAARRATPPSGSTLTSISSMLVGRIAKDGNFEDDGYYLRWPGDGTSRRWTPEGSIFEQLAADGMNSALVGQDYIPFCRTLHPVLAHCAEMNRDWTPGQAFFYERIDVFFGRLVGYVPILNRMLRPDLFGPAHDYEQFLGKVLDLAADPALALSLVHWNVPHAPYIWDRQSNSYINATEEPSKYFDNAVYADRMLAAVIARLAQADLSENTTLIVSSDHWWRRAAAQYDGVTDTRVPFIVGFPREAASVSFDVPFNTVVTRELIAAILAGRVESPQQAATLIARHIGHSE